MPEIFNYINPYIKEETLANFAKLVNEFGYLCVASENKYRIGQIVNTVNIGTQLTIEHPWIVREEATKQDFDEQVKFLGIPPFSRSYHNFYYKVTTD